MIYPSIDKLTVIAESKYSLVVAAARRARQLQEGAKKLVSIPSNKNVTIALNEIDIAKVTFVRIKEGVK